MTQNSINTSIPIEVSNGGTGISTTTAYSLICAGTTATGNFQNVSGVGTSAQVLTSNGAGALPTWQATAYTTQTGFLAYLGTSQNDVTGNGANYKLGTFALTEVFDTGSDFNTNGTYTAPSTNKYVFSAGVYSGDYIAVGRIYASLVTSNGTFSICDIITTSNFTISANAQSSGIFTEMDAGDTAAVYIYATGQSTNRVDVGGASRQTFFSGFLAF